MLRKILFLCVPHIFSSMAIAQPNSLEEIGSYNTPGIAQNIHVQNGYAYVADWDAGLRIIDMSDPTNPREVAAVTNIGQAYHVHVVGSFAYVSERPATLNPGGVWIIDISLPRNPIVIAAYQRQSYLNPVNNVFVLGDHAYLCLGHSGFAIIDISDRTNPTVISEIRPGGHPAGVFVQNTLAFIAGDGFGLLIYDVSNPQNPQRLGAYLPPTRGGADVFVSGSHAYLAAKLGGLRILDISAPNNPIEIGSYETQAEANDVWLSGSTAFIAVTDSGLLVLDVSDPTNPLRVGRIGAPDLAQGVFAADRYGYLAANNAGLRIIELKSQHETKTFVLVADRQVTIQSPSDSEGDIHSNNDIIFKKGNPGSHTGNLTAVDDIVIASKTTIIGDVTAGDDLKISEDVTITGTAAENAPVAEIPLPAPLFTAGGSDEMVSKHGSLTLPSGSYGDVRVRKHGTLFLSSGDYFIESLRLDGLSVLSIDVTDGPVKINVEDNLQFGKKVEVVITPTGETGTDQVSFTSLQDQRLRIGKDARVLGTLIAPYTAVSLGRKSRFKGAICAERIMVAKETVFLHHTANTSLPKMASVENWNQEEAEFNSAVTDFALFQNYPNPFNPTTTITFDVRKSGEITLSIYNLRGQLVRMLISGPVTAGRHEVVWDGSTDNGSRVATGIYVYRLAAKDFTIQKKLILTR